MYNTTAFLYDRVAACETPEKVCQLLQSYLLRHGVSASGHLGDFGSGTGVLSILLATQGWSIHGVEISAAMIDIAKEKTAELPEQVQSRLAWTQGDITDFTPQPGLLLDGAICMHNTINHLPDLSQVNLFLLSAYRALKPGGVLILDSDTLATFLAFFNHGPVVVWDDGQHRLTRACSLDSVSGRAEHVAILEQYIDDGIAKISEEAMPLQHYGEADLAAAFAEAGFQLLQAEPFNPNPTLYPVDFIPKVLWILLKPAG